MDRTELVITINLVNTSSDSINLHKGVSVLHYRFFFVLEKKSI